MIIGVAGALPAALHLAVGSQGGHEGFRQPLRRIYARSPLFRKFGLEVAVRAARSRLDNELRHDTRQQSHHDQQRQYENEYNARVRALSCGEKSTTGSSRQASTPATATGQSTGDSMQHAAKSLHQRHTSVTSVAIAKPVSAVQMRRA